MNDKVIQFPTKEEMAEEERQCNELILEGQKTMLRTEIVMAVFEASKRKNQMMTDGDILDVVLSTMYEMMVNGGHSKKLAKSIIIRSALKIDPLPPLK